MTPSEFEIHVLLPADAAYAMTLRELAAHAARYAGLDPVASDAFAAEVATVASAQMQAARAPVGALVRRQGGPVEAVVGSGSAARRVTRDVPAT